MKRIGQGRGAALCAALTLAAALAVLPGPAMANQVTCPGMSRITPTSEFVVRTSDGHGLFQKVNANTVLDALEALAAPPGITPAGVQPPQTQSSPRAVGAPSCQTDDRGPLAPPCPDPGSGAITYTYDEHIPNDAVNPTGQILDAAGTPMSAGNPPCPGTSYSELAPQDNAPPLPGETVPAGDRNYRVRFTVTNPAGGPAGGATPTVDVRVTFEGGEQRDPTLKIAKVQFAVVSLQGGALAARRTRCAYMTSTRPSFRTSAARHGRCDALVWLNAPFSIDAQGIAHARLKLANPLGRGTYVAYLRASTAAGAVETRFVDGVNRVAFTIKKKH